MFLIFPHQLFEDTDPLRGHQVCLIEEPLFMTQYRFHVQKLMLHRASMKAYEAKLLDEGFKVRYVEVEECDGLRLTEAVCYDPADYDLLKKWRKQVEYLEILPSPNFTQASSDSLFMHHFYVHERKRLDLLMDGRKPMGGKWSFDGDNRKRFDKKRALPVWLCFDNSWLEEAREYVKKFETIGEAEAFYYPVTHHEAQVVLKRFLQEHFETFGDFQDAMTPKDSPLYHSMISSALNIGLLDPMEVVNAAIAQDVPLNAKEGFVRQIIGWREFMRRTYEDIGVSQRTRNFFGFTRAMPKAVYHASTGLAPLDDVLSKVHVRAYAHHIERLMILGNFFLLIEVDPNAVYEYFMASFIDAYDWVMVGNVYGMSQYADGGMMTTKPYISGSNYLLKMSHYPKGEWCEIWDALYWRFLFKHRERFADNQRMRLALINLDKMSQDKLQGHIELAEAFIARLQ